jgi:hypothetical protein
VHWGNVWVYTYGLISKLNECYLVFLVNISDQPWFVKNESSYLTLFNSFCKSSLRLLVSVEIMALLTILPYLEQMFHFFIHHTEFWIHHYWLQPAFFTYSIILSVFFTIVGLLNVEHGKCNEHGVLHLTLVFVLGMWVMNSFHTTSRIVTISFLLQSISAGFKLPFPFKNWTNHWSTLKCVTKYNIRWCMFVLTRNLVCNIKSSWACLCSRVLMYNGHTTGYL